MCCGHLLCCLRNFSMLAGLSLFLSIAQSAPTFAKSLTFYAPFDGDADAVHALGDGRIYNAKSGGTRGDAQPGLPAEGIVKLAPNQGKFGDALQFTRKKSPLVFFKAAGNMSHKLSDWNGAVSFWLSLDPEKDLEPGYCDPIQITPRAWNDAAFFVEFGKDEKPRHFRLGAYADFKVWNPNNRNWDTIPFSEKPLVSVEQPPFGRGRWTHVAFTFEHFNTGMTNGIASLYLDGKPQGSLSPRQQTFTWNPAKSAIMLGLSYIGLFDELAIFDRSLSAAEVAELNRLPNGVRSLLAR